MICLAFGGAVCSIGSHAFPASPISYALNLKQYMANAAEAMFSVSLSLELQISGLT
jgi:hypothetical protein